jgi:aspartate/methionine/tyrosine aminotransferase
MMKTFDERRRLIVSGLNDIPGISCVNPKGAFYAFPNVKQLGMSAKELELKLLNEAGVAILSGTAFGAFGEGYLRFSYASSTDNIREALRRVKDCLAAAGAKR